MPKIDAAAERRGRVARHQQQSLPAAHLPQNNRRLDQFISCAKQLGAALLTVNDAGFLAVSLLMLLLEAVIVQQIIQRVPYTEIDWKTYMRQVRVYLKGQRNYSQITGPTGPIVYPAAHLYVYRFLYSVTDNGKNVQFAQYIFGALYLANLALVLRLFHLSKRIPPFVPILMCLTSYRVHSIFVLRLFNDPIAMFLFFAAINFFVSRHWLLGCLLYSLAVGVKMNILLFAPALFFILLLNNGVSDTIWLLSMCALLQVSLALEFLLFDPWAYLSRAFELNRVFLFKWTVNWRLLPQWLFLDRRFHLLLLLFHISLLSFFALKMWFRGQGSLRILLKKLSQGICTRLDTHEILFALFTSNLIGIAFARSLHYQFYCWYYHSIHYLLFSSFNFAGSSSYIAIFNARDRRRTALSSADECDRTSAILPPLGKAVLLRVLILLLVELCWNTYPSTVASSLLLHLLHLSIFILLLKTALAQGGRVTKENKRLMNSGTIRHID